MIKFAESGHQVFQATSPLFRGTLKNKGGGKLSIHFCADGDTIETVFRTIIVKGMYPAPDIHEHFTVHKWLRQTAYILTHNMNNLEHIANNGTDTTKHTDVYNAQF